MPNLNLFKRFISAIQNLLTNFLSQEEKYKKEADKILLETLKKQDQKKMDIIKNRINKI